MLDLTRLVIGGYLTQAMADLGAEVIKVEEPGSGEPGRHQEPRVGGESYYHLILDRNKASIRLNLKDPRGKAIFCRLAETADVVVENFRPGVMDRLGLGYETLRSINPGLVYCALSGFGQEGPRRNQPAHDLNLQAMAGHLAMAAPDGGHPPMPGILAVDLCSSLWGATAILAALMERKRSGEGQHIDLAMFDVSLSILGLFAGRYFADPGAPPSAGLAGKAPNYNIYQTADGGYVALAAWEEVFWRNFCKAVDRPDLAEPPGSQEERDRQVAEVRRIFASRTLEEWVTMGQEGDFCLTGVRNIGEACADPQAVARGMVFTMNHPSAGLVRQLASPARLSRTPPGYRTPPPRFGQDTRRVLIQAGFSEEEVTQLAGDGVIGLGPEQVGPEQGGGSKWCN